jgi:hypothetical protein
MITTRGARRAAAVSAAALVPALAAGCGGSSAASHSTQSAAPAATAQAAPAGSAPADSGSAAPTPSGAADPDQAGDLTVCHAFSQFISGGTTSDLATALDTAGPVSPGLARDVQAVLNGTTLSQDEKADVFVSLDCALVKNGKQPPASPWPGS